jgi:FixJ family two-component response regulator
MTPETVAEETATAETVADEKATVFIVDDDPNITGALCELIEIIDLKPAAYNSADDFLEAYKPDGPACLVLDIRMPGMSGLELQKELVSRGDNLPIIIITGHGDIRMAVEAMGAGAFNFLEKPFRTQELCDNIQNAVKLDEERWQNHEQQEDARGRIEKLTPAERAVLGQVVAGKTNKMIAEELDVSVRAVEDRRARMMKRLEVESRAELLEVAAAAGLR